jgi:drug/metabolite transporter (DMT)-like permease
MLNVAMTLTFAIIMGAGQIVLSYASKEIFSVGELSFRVVAGSKWLWLGIFIYASSMILWIYILSKFDVKYAYPISSTAIFFAAIFQSIIQRTLPSGYYWLGLAFVTAGLVILSLDNHS